MINRRHIRIKVMQASYAMLISNSDNLNAQENKLYQSIEQLHKLYVLQYNLLIVIRDRAQKHYEISQKRYVSKNSVWELSDNIIRNKVLLQLIASPSIKKHEPNKGDTQWKDYPEVIDNLWSNIKTSRLTEDYLSIDYPKYDDDKEFVIALFKEIIAPNENIYDFYESQTISWIDDIPFVNTWVLQQLEHLKHGQLFHLDRLYKNPEDKYFAKQLLHKTMLNFNKYEKIIIEKVPNWDADRITKVDKLLMVMAMAEFLNFPSIPTKVSINEYIEIAKDYATQNSSFFINGVLDKIVVDYNKENKIQKIGRGLV